MRKIQKYQTELVGIFVALLLISVGLIIPTFIPDQIDVSDQFPEAFEDLTYLKTFITFLLIGLGILCFAWLVIIQRFILHKSKKDYVY